MKYSKRHARIRNETAQSASDTMEAESNLLEESLNMRGGWKAIDHLAR
jgi:hypothetical protein